MKYPMYHGVKIMFYMKYATFSVARLCSDINRLFAETN
jgi:hypothetical protein